MSEGNRSIPLFAAALIGFALHAAFSHALQIGEARPNLALCTLLIGSLFAGMRTGATLGFFVGLLEGSYAAFYLGSFLVTRSLAGFVVGSLEERIFRDHIAVAFTTALTGTALVEGCFFLFVPQPHFLRWGLRVLLESLYNAALAIPLYLLLRRFARSRKET